jgi:hypothetical protein
MNRKSIFILTILFAIFSYVLFSFHLVNSFVINTDYGRDLYVVAQILKGSVTLIGPALSSGFYSGPYYYYLWVLPLAVSHWSPNSILYSNAFIFAVFSGVTLFYYLKKTAFFLSLLSGLIIVLSPIFLIAARFPANGFTYLPLLFLFFFLINTKFKSSPFLSPSLGILMGLLVNFHPITLLATLPVIFFPFLKLGKKHKLFFLLGFLVTFAPLGLFEIRHDFVITKGFFLQKSYQGFVKNDVVENSVSGFSNPFLNYNFLSPYISDLVVFSPLILLVMIILAVFPKTKNSLKWVLPSLISLVITVLSVRFRFQYHYLFPLACLILFTFIDFFSNYKKGYFFLSLLLILEVINFPSRLYKPGNREFFQFQNAVDLTINTHRINPGDKFNLIAVADKHIYVPVGNEYRFAYLKRGINPLPETNYVSANKLVVFSEIGPIEPVKLHLWSTEQFGENSLASYNTATVSSIFIYTASK